MMKKIVSIVLCLALLLTGGPSTGIQDDSNVSITNKIEQTDELNV